MERSRRRFVGAGVSILAASLGLSANCALANTEAAAGFLPSIHGWPFKNFIAKYPVKHATVCGGMCWTAVDRFFRKANIEADIAIPAEGDSLYEEIKAAQWATITSGAWEEIFAWTYRSELDWGWQAESQGLLTQTQQWPQIRQSIAAGRPAIVCLIRADQWGNPGDNHQVVAYRYEHSKDHVVLGVYDPNHGRNDDVIVGFDLGKKQSRLSAYQNTGEKVRGLLVVPYIKEERQ